MLTLTILGFLAERPMHAYELRGHVSGLIGHSRPVSDGALYPAITRLVDAGQVERREQPGQGGPARRELRITTAGRAELLRRLAEPKPAEITDGGAFFTLLAFLSNLPEPDRQAAVLQRRLDFLTQPAGFFHRDGSPVRIKDEPDRYRKGMLVMARATQRAERAWLEETLHELRGEERPGS